jgi:thiamine pyrophosphate-dependent acetolactate synthase large subunit-like protein
LVVLTGQVATRFRTPPGSALRQLGFQETPIVEIVRPITKYARTVTAAEEIGWTMDQAIAKATEGRAGPVLIDLPNDVQRAEIDAKALQRWTPSLPTYPDPAGPAAAFLRDLAAAKRPGILVGGGAYRARAAILRFAAARKIPVFKTWNAQDVCPDDHPCYGGTVGTYGGPGRNFGIQNTDLLLALGCRLSGRITGGVPESFARGAKQVILTKFDAGLWLAEMERTKAGYTFLVPTMIALVLDHPDLLKRDTSSLRRLYWGASPIPPNIAARAQEVFGKVLAQTYGQSEAPMAITCLGPDEHDRVGSGGRA